MEGLAGWREPMITVSSDNTKTGIAATDERPSALEVILLKRTYVLPWTQFLYAEGGEDEVRLAFATHDVVVNGSHLDLLLADLLRPEVEAASRAGKSREVPPRKRTADNRCLSPQS